MSQQYQFEFMTQEAKATKPASINDMIVVNLSAAEPPKFVEPRGGQGLILYGEDNLWPDYAIYLYENSPKHNSIINHKVRYATSGGFAVKTLGKSVQHISGFNALIKQKNEHKDNLNRIVKKCDLDYEIFNGFAIEMIWTHDGKKAVPHYIPFGLIRCFIEGDKVRYAYLPSWKNVKTLEKARAQKGYREFDYYGTNKEGSELIYYKEFRPIKSGESDAYPVPYYLGAIAYIECDIEVASYCVNGIHNEFWGSQMITFTNGAPETEEQKRQIESKFIRNKTGTKHARRVVLNFVNDEKQKPIIDKLSQDNIGDQFETLNKQIRDELFTCHNVTNASMFGIPEEGGLSGRTERLESYELFNSLWNIPRQETLNEEFECIFTEQGLAPDLYLEETKPSGITFSENVVVQVMDPEDLKEQVYKQMGITPKNDRTTVRMAAQEEEQFFYALENSGGSDDKNIHHSVKVELNDQGEPTLSDSGFRALYMAKVFDVEITDLEADIISAVANTPSIKPEQLAEALNTTVDKVNAALARLFDLKIFTGQIGEIKITKAGQEIIDENEIPLDIEVEYTYSDEGAPPLAKNGKSRAFCARLMAMARAGRTWTRAQIDKMKNADGRSAWIYRGGFYHNPITDEDEPFCRHHWKAVFKKRRRATA